MYAPIDVNEEEEDRTTKRRNNIAMNVMAAVNDNVTTIAPPPPNKDLNRMISRLNTIKSLEANNDPDAFSDDSWECKLYYF